MKRCAVLLLFVVFSFTSFACSTFLLNKNGQLLFGRNYDWVTGNGMMTVNYRGLQKKSFGSPDDKSIIWTSGYGSITFNQYGKEFPTGGMNEKGLVVELMWLNETKYPAADQRPSLHVLQWIQYQLDNCATVADVLATDKIIRLSAANSAPLHYLVADAAGNVAAIEFLDGKMVVHKNKELTYPVLTNTVYTDAVRQTKNNKAQSYGDNSVERFATACRMVQQFQDNQTTEAPVDYAFRILDRVAQGDFTKWRIVYDISGRQVYFTTENNPQRKHFAFTDFSFACSPVNVFFDLQNKVSGPVSVAFKPLTADRNRGILQRSFAESRSRLNVSEAAVSAAADYSATIVCRIPQNDDSSLIH